MQKTLFVQSTKAENGDNPIDRADSREGFKKTKAGIIPEDWSICKLRDIIEEINAGYSARSRDRTIRDGEVGVLKVSAATHGTFQAQEHKAVEPDAVEDVKISPRAGDLVMSRSSGTESLVGACVYVEEDRPNLYLPDTLWQIKVKDGLSARWLNYALASERMRAKIRGEAYGTSGMKKLSMRRLRGLRISLPPPEEQRRIADILRTWDRAIEQTDALIDRKQTRLHGLCQRLLKGKERFPEFSEPWEKVKIGTLLKRVRRYVDWDDDATYNLVSIKRDSEGMVFRESLKGDEIKTKKLHTLKEGDFVISRMQVVHGATAYVSEEFDGMHASDSYIILVPRDENRIDTEFFAWLSKLPYLYHIAYTSSYGVHIEKMTFNPEWYYDSEVRIPPSVEEQRKIVRFLKTAQSEMEKLKEKKKALKRQKKGLMQRLLTGKVRTI